MTKQELQQRIKNDMDYHMEEFGLSMAEAFDITADNYILGYIAAKVSEEDLMALMEEMGYSVDIKKLKEEKMKREARKAYRKELQAKKSAEKVAKKAQKEVI